MSREISFHELAELELNDAADFYDSRQLGLGSSFLRIIHEAALQISERPKSARVIRGNARRKVLTRFPYNIIYSKRRTRSEYSLSLIRAAGHSIGAADLKSHHG